VRIQIVDAQNRPMFDVGSAHLRDYTTAILRELAPYLDSVPNRISLTGHTDVRPYPSNNGYTNWELSADRANAARRALVAGGLPDEKISRVVGLSSSVLFNKAEPQSPINRRISIVVMTKQAEQAALATDVASAETPAEPTPAAPAGASEAAPTPAAPAPAPAVAPAANATPAAQPTATPAASTTPVTQPTATPAASTTPVTRPTATPAASTTPVARPTAAPAASTTPVTRPTAAPAASTTPVTQPTATPAASTTPVARPTAAPVATASANTPRG
jgi:chemotaxis protein MotB